jgi:hypothetical protein
MSFPCADDFAQVAAGGATPVSALAASTLAFLESVHKATPGALESKVAELAKLAGDFLAGEEDVESLRAQVSRLRADVQEWQRRSGVVEVELAAVKRRSGVVEAELAAVKSDLSELRRGLADLTRSRDRLWLREAAATVFHRIACHVMDWDDAERAAARADTLAQLRGVIALRDDRAERSEALERRLAELGLTKSSEEAVARVKRLGNAEAHCDVFDGGELSAADVCAAFEAKAAVHLPARVVSPRAGAAAPTFVSIDDGREVVRLLRLVLGAEAR